MNLKKSLISELKAQHILKPTEIQERLIPSIINGKSVIGQSQTGTGKTLTYLLPILHHLDNTLDVCQAVITTPTRELADQIYKEILKLLPKQNSHHYRIRKVVGGMDRKRMLDQIKKPPHIVVGTPGRISDFVKSEELNVFSANTLVIDEADLMLEMGFLNDVDIIAARMAKDLQMLVFSATIPKHLQPFLNKYMSNPKFVKVEHKQATEANIEHLLIPYRHRDVNRLMIEITKVINPYLALIFTNTKTKADEVYAFMASEGFRVERIHGGLSPRERKQAMRRIDRLECEYIVATDLASRGIDIKGISHVINLEIPDELDFFIHRVGRTGRAGLKGEAITLYQRENDMNKINALEKRGITFRHVDIKNNEWVETPQKKKRKHRAKTTKQPKIKLPKPKKIKPGYKKKLQEKQNKLNKKRNR